jgi:tRNA (uracil-5-)-methyltransferase TRM9
MNFEEKYVKKTYEIISDSWKNLRRSFWFIKRFAKKIKNKKILDAGCGDCSQLIEFKENFLFGIDFSKRMISEARKKCKSAKLVIGDIRFLPFKDKSFDIVLCIATLHHVKERKERIKVLKELKRVCKEKIIISVLKRFSSLTFFKLIFSLFDFRLRFGDIFLKWNYKGKKLKRYYHTYSLNELKKDVEIAGLRIEKILEDKYNFILVLS